MSKNQKTEKICKTCLSPNAMRRVIYGFPEFPFDESKFVLGGCIPGGPNWRCTNCDPVTEDD